MVSQEWNDKHIIYFNGNIYNFINTRNFQLFNN